MPSPKALIPKVLPNYSKPLLVTPVLKMSLLEKNTSLRSNFIGRKTLKEGSLDATGST